MHIHFGNERWNQVAAFQLRYEVFVLEQGIALVDEFDTLDSNKRYYFVAYEQNVPIATIRYQKKAATTIQPDRFCVKKTHRNQGIGTQLLQLLEETAKKEGCTQSFLIAEIVAQPFYERFGYHPCSQPLIEDGILCIQMKKNLN